MWSQYEAPTRPAATASGSSPTVTSTITLLLFFADCLSQQAELDAPCLMAKGSLLVGGQLNSYPLTLSKVPV